jgi:hypothetical protein
MRLYWGGQRVGLVMIDVRDALAEISSIRSHLARGTEFRGYSPASVAATGFLAAGVALLQSHWIPATAQTAASYLVTWVATAVASLGLIGIVAVVRSRRIHTALAAQMLNSAFEQILPPIVAGMLLTVVLLRFAPQELWMLPGLWQVLLSLGVFASCRLLPRPIFAVGVWYLASGMVCLAIARGNGTFSPWEMGIPFGVGQLLVAALLRLGYRDLER